MFVFAFIYCTEHKTEAAYMNTITEKEFYCDTAPITDGAKGTSVALGDTWRLIIAASVGILCAVAAVLIPLFPSALSNAINASAVSFAENLQFGRTFSGAVTVLSELCSKELYLALFLLLSHAVIFGKRLIIAAVPIHTFFRTVCAVSVFNTNVGTYSAVTVLASSAASVLFFVLSAKIALRFADSIREDTDNASFSAIFNFSLKILSALGGFIVTEVLILLPSAFI